MREVREGIPLSVKEQELTDHTKSAFFYLPYRRILFRYIADNNKYLFILLSYYYVLVFFAQQNVVKNTPFYVALA